MSILYDSTAKFRRKLEKKSKDELLEILRLQDPKIIEQINRIEWVFANKLSHVKWPDGTPITGRPLTKRELILLVDEPFVPNPELSKMGISLTEQKQMHLAKDPCTFAKHFLGITPRVYQTLILRDPHHKKILRTGRRLGKTVSLTIQMLHYCFIKKRAKVIVLAPAKVQVEEIFNEVNKYIDESPILGETFIKRKIRSPQFFLQFNNGSTIKFFTTGVSSASKADIVRGQEADLVVLDEMDYMHPDDFIAIMALLQKTDENQDEKKLIAASTPTGRRERFYHWIVDPPAGFTNFYFPSYVNPNWTDQVEEEQRDFYKSNFMAYRHEIEADFGENTEGVYPRRFLDQCFVHPIEEDGLDPSWEYKSVLTDAQCDYVMGVDWNKFSAGTMIVVLQIFPAKHPDPEFQGKIRVCYREEIQQEEYSLLHAVDRIIELNRSFRPKYIYIDQGFGEVQHELLKKYGIENPSSGLHKKLKAINSATKPEIRDPHTGELQKRPYKSLMVNSLRDMMEERMILFPHHDDALYRELHAYVVERYSSSGEPIFASSGTQTDHVHDALALACLAITERMSQFAKKRRFKVPVVVNINNFELDTEKNDSYSSTEVTEISVNSKAAPIVKNKDWSPVLRSRSLTKKTARSRGTITRKMF